MLVIEGTEDIEATMTEIGERKLEYGVLTQALSVLALSVLARCAETQISNRNLSAL